MNVSTVCGLEILVRQPDDIRQHQGLVLSQISYSGSTDIYVDYVSSCGFPLMPVMLQVVGFGGASAATQVIGKMRMCGRDRTGTLSGTVPARNNVSSVRSRNIFCSGAGAC